MSIPRRRIALTGAALIVLTVGGIGLAQAAQPSAADSAGSVLTTAAPGASTAPTAGGRLRALRHLVHGTITFDYPDEGLVTVQLDGGSISAVDADSITVAEAGGASVTVAIDDGTRVRVDGKKVAVADLKAGQTVRVVSRIGDAGAVTARRIIARTASD